MNKLTVESMIKEGFKIGLKNTLPLAINIILWALTCWIPYLNIGTSIGLIAGLAAKASRDEAISFTEIFNPVYRKRMGEFFIGWSLMSSAILLVSLMTLFIGGIVLSIAWSLSLLLIVDKELNPMEAINKSNDLTYGKKGTIFLGNLVVSILLMIALAIILGITGLIHPALAVLFAIIAIPASASIFIGSRAHVYKALAGK